MTGLPTFFCTKRLLFILTQRKYEEGTINKVVGNPCTRKSKLYDGGDVSLKAPKHEILELEFLNNL